MSLNQIWFKAAVIGSLWSGIEIIIGSYLHNLRIPFAGTLLTMNAIALMVAFSRFWPEKGLFWRAGLICALLKAISPSAVIFGPMIGIFLQSLLFQVSIYLFGRNLFAYLVAGALAVSSSFLHKVGRLLIIYGLDLLPIAENLYSFAVKQIKLPDMPPLYALLAVLGIYIILGLSGALFGYFMVNINKNNLNTDHPFSATEKMENDFLKIDKNQSFSLWLLFLHIAIIVSGMSAINMISLWIASLVIFLYVGFNFYHYRTSIRHLKRFGFWLQIIFLIALSTLFYNGLDKGNVLDPVGLLAGIKMSLRAILMAVGFAALSMELRNPVVELILTTKGFHNLYYSLGLAFSALPAAFHILAKPKQGIRHPGHIIEKMILTSEYLLQQIKDKQEKSMKIFLITGEEHDGKTTFLKEVVRLLTNESFRLKGFFAEGFFVNGERSKFDLVDVETGSRIWLSGKKELNSFIDAKQNQKGAFIQVGRYVFNPEAFLFGREILLRPDKDIAVIDEVGYLELKNEGWAMDMARLYAEENIVQIWVVRTKLVLAIKNRWLVPGENIFQIQEKQPRDLIKKIMSEIKKNQQKD